MAPLIVRKFAKQLGILNSLTNFKRKFIYRENAFKPADPRLLLAMNHCLDILKEKKLLEGSDYYEFGIYRGFNLWYVQQYLDSLNIKDINCYGFDSFFGLPEVKGIDAGGAFNEGDFYASRFEVEKFFNRFGADWKRLFLIEGWFKDSLNNSTREKYSLRKVSLCLVDSDLYESAVDVLNFVSPNLQNGSIIWFDDWRDYGDDVEKGEQKAFSEFLEKRPDIKVEEINVPNVDGKGFSIFIS